MPQVITADAELNCIGIYCPGPIAMTRDKIDTMSVGQVLKVDTDDPSAEEDLPRWAKRTGHEVMNIEKSGATMTFYIRRVK